MSTHKWRIINLFSGSQSFLRQPLEPTYAEVARLHRVRGDIVGVDENRRNFPPHLTIISVASATEAD